MSYNPEFSDVTKSLFEFIDEQGVSQVTEVLSSLYDDRAANSYAGAIGDTIEAQDAIATSLIGAYQEFGEVGKIETHFLHPAVCMINAMRARTAAIEHEYRYSELHSLLAQRPTDVEIQTTSSNTTPQYSVDMSAYRSSGLSGVALDIEVSDEEDRPSLYELKMSKIHQIKDHQNNKQGAIKLIVIADAQESEYYPNGEKLLFDIPDFHKKAVTEAIVALLGDEISAQFDQELVDLEKILNETVDPAERRNRLDERGFYF